jgi:hypothetical protein
VSTHKREQIEKNYAAFVKELPKIALSHGGKFALMHDGEIVGYYDTSRDAVVAGEAIYPDGLFSVQQVTEKPVDLGYYSHAVPGRSV